MSPGSRATVTSRPSGGPTYGRPMTTTLDLANRFRKQNLFRSNEWTDGSETRLPGPNRRARPSPADAVPAPPAFHPGRLKLGMISRVAHADRFGPTLLTNTQFDSYGPTQAFAPAWPLQRARTGTDVSAGTLSGNHSARSSHEHRPRKPLPPRPMAPATPRAPARGRTLAEVASGLPYAPHR
jgi:hypothetical protein